MVSLRRSVLMMVSISGLRDVLSRATATSGLRWMSMGQSELTSLARYDVTSLVCGTACLVGRVDVCIAEVVGTIGWLVVDALSNCCVGKYLQSSLYRGGVRHAGESCMEML